MSEIREPIDGTAIPAELRPTIAAIAGAALELSDRISRHKLAVDFGAKVGTNSDGDRQTALDVFADDVFSAALTEAGVRFYASEEREDITELSPSGDVAVAIDPLDGSSNIDTNISIGTIFGLYRTGDSAQASFLRPGTEQAGAGYVIYGPQTVMMLTFGAGTTMLVLDRSTGAFVPVQAAVRVPAHAAEYAVNASNYRHWPQPVRSYIDECIAGAEGPGGENYNMRWIASLVAETHRVMTRGGIFLYPSDARPGYERGRLRRLYECAPIAMLIEQAGGKATDGENRILDQRPQSLHERTPFVFGSATEVDRVASHHSTPDLDLSALFGVRGLFRV